MHTPPCEEEERSNKADGGGKGMEPPPARSGEQPRDHQGLGAPRQLLQVCYHVTPFPIWNQSVVSCPILTVVS